MITRIQTILKYIHNQILRGSHVLRFTKLHAYMELWTTLPFQLEASLCVLLFCVVENKLMFEFLLPCYSIR